jgi:hypothetical protein
MTSYTSQFKYEDQSAAVTQLIKQFLATNHSFDDLFDKRSESFKKFGVEVLKKLYKGENPRVDNEVFKKFWNGVPGTARPGFFAYKSDFAIGKFNKDLKLKSN